ncbi:MAG: hypothetical protein QOD64_2390 [Verrucomicrobiota bacterium]|jgi:radical SAM family RiPP maturation amino acid epimerase
MPTDSSGNPNLAANVDWVLANDPEIAVIRDCLFGGDNVLRWNVVREPNRFFPSGRIETAHVKRFMECYFADPQFRDGLMQDPKAAAALYGLDIDPERLRLYWDRQGAIDRYGDAAFDNIDIARQQAYVKLRGEYRDKLIYRSPNNVRFAKWRTRQVARCSLELTKTNADNIVHAPACFELSKGCSVGCWFCGVSALKFNGHWRYEGANIQLWRDIAAFMAGLLGPAADKAFLYWGTDPLDNPDYLHFARNWHAATGFFPQTTTAIPLRNVALTRQMLHDSTMAGTIINRFSILTTRVLKNLYAEFTPEELLFVELVPQNEGSLLVKAAAGKARNNAERLEKSVIPLRKIQTDTGAISAIFKQPGTIACVSGFLFNMVERTVQLITPCKASNRWPNGYIIVDSGQFEDVESLAQLINRFIAENMNETIQDDMVVRPIDELKVEPAEAGFSLRGEDSVLHFRNEAAPGYFQTLGDMLSKGGSKKRDLVETLEARFGVERHVSNQVLQQIYERGVLAEVES